MKIHELLENSDSSPTMTLWHGGNLTDDLSLISQKKGRFEYGSGLYTTTHYGTARKYAKGSRKLYKIVLSKGNDANSTTIDYDAAINFVDSYVTRSKRNEVKSRMEKFKKDSVILAEIFNNIILNSEAITASNTRQLSQFLVDQGIDYLKVSNAFGWGEMMIVIFNLKKIVKIQRVMPTDKIEVFDLPTEFSEDWDLDAYHGTGSDIRAFSLDKAGKGAGSRESPIGFWFTNNPDAATVFADWSAKGQGANVMPVKLRLKNPLVVDDYNEIRALVDRFTTFARPGYMTNLGNIRMTQDKVDYNGVRKWLKSQGYDGIILKNTLVDSPDAKTRINQYVVLDPNQIRSKFAKFDPAKKHSADIVDEDLTS